jgi:hypothetical protein
MLLAEVDYPFLNILWSTILFLVFFMWIWLAISCLSDLFRRHDVSGWGKAAWTVFVIVAPYLGVLIYLITQGKGMAERNAQNMQAAQAQFDDHVRSVAGGPASEIAQAKELLDKGAITQAEFDGLKQKALAAG